MSTGAITEIYFDLTAANKLAIVKLKAKAPAGRVIIGDEVFTYTGVDTNKNHPKLTGVTRAALQTAAAAHSDGSVVSWLQYEFWIYYGNVTLSTRLVSTADQPIIDMDASTNNSWVFSNFRDLAGLNSSIWNPGVASSNSIDTTNQSGYYTNSHDTMVWPATVMGMSLKSWRKGNGWNIDTAKIIWSLNVPGEASSITVASGSKYRSGTAWPLVVFEKSTDGLVWEVVWTEATPATAATWTAMTAHTGVALGGGYTAYRFRLEGTIGAAANAKAMMEYGPITLAVTNKLPISVSPEFDCYTFDSLIENTTTNEWVSIFQGMLINTDLVINTDAKTVYLEGHQPIGNIDWSTVRRDWLRLKGGDNVLQIIDADIAGATIVLSWEDRLAVAL